MRILFCGSGDFAVPSLRTIIAGGHELAGIVTQPARPAGRGGKLKPTAIAALARSEGMDITETANINDDESVRAIRDSRPEVCCVVDFGQLIRSTVREVPALGAFNLHGSLLPELRGAAPVNWAIVRGYERTGVTTFSLVDEMDAGPIYLQAETEIRPGETAEELRVRLADIGARVVGETLDLLASGLAGPRGQDHTRATAAPRMKKSDGVIDWSASAADVRNLICGTWRWPGGQAVFRRADGKETHVIIARAEVGPGAGGEPGELDDDLAVVAGEARLRILEIKPAGKRLMSWRDFVNGYRAAAGDRFVGPTK